MKIMTELLSSHKASIYLNRKALYEVTHRNSLKKSYCTHSILIVGHLRFKNKLYPAKTDNGSKKEYPVF